MTTPSLWPRMLELTWWAALEEAAERHGDNRTAFLFEGPEWSAELSFGRWRDGALALSGGLAALGAGPGERVAVLGMGGPAWPVLQLACSRLGSIIVPVNSRYRQDELEHVLRLARPVVMVSAERVHTTDTLAAVQAAASATGVRVRFISTASPDVPVTPGDREAPDAAADRTLDWEEFLALSARAPVPAAAGDPDAPVLLQFTSGTTAFPKGALLRNGGTLGTAYWLAERMGLNTADRFFSTQPFYHVGGSVATTLMPLACGCTMVAPERYTVEEVFRLIAKYRCTARTGQAAMYWMELAHERFAPEIFATVAKGWAGGTPELRRLIVERMGITGLTTVYGLTEAGATSTVPAHDSPLEVRTETCGPALPGVGVGILADGEIVATPAVDGEICVRGWPVMAGYYDDPEATAATIDEAGWLHTGDLGRIDADGNLIVVDRIKDMIKPGGENVSPAEVERVLSTLDDVVQVAVVGMPDERLGEVPVAFVELQPGSAQTAEAIVERCAERIASFKVPRRVVIVSSWPLTESGKIQKQALRQRLAGNATTIIGATG